MHKFITRTFLFIIPVMLFAFDKKKKASRFKWDSTTEVTQKWNKEKKPIIIDIYTDWCVYCRLMERNIYANDSVSDYIGRHFYASKVNAEYPSTYEWMGRQYEYMARFKVNRLAVELVKGNMVYPSTVIIPVTGEPIIIAGAMKMNEMEAVLKFVNTGENTRTSLEAFKKTFHSSW